MKKAELLKKELKEDFVEIQSIGKEIAEKTPELIQKRKEITNKYNKVKEFKPFAHKSGWCVMFISLFLYLTKAEAKISIFYITKEFWQMIFFLSIFLLSVAYIFSQVKLNFELAEYNHNREWSIRKEIELKQKLDKYAEKSRELYKL